MKEALRYIDEIGTPACSCGTEADRARGQIEAHISEHKDKRVFTESDVRAMLKAVRDELEANCRWQSRVEVVSASAMRQAFHRPDVLSLDPA